ncbi:hypothetical protein AK830_g3547 [Neonectria ditissima]|uniref:Uncharacterized protein n=1 Tax=Neonectria ditissima TaxID=78410 RepID=A0A0N8H7X3_9HYPO|nr:hypothetical protein AK830_g3547 [Neonectria ditissima]
MTSRALLVALAALTALSATNAEALSPSAEVAAQRGPQIFNAVYDSLRKWGSVVHPNGMSLYLATVPEGVMLHHGNARNETPTELQWLAYEIEHAEMFARDRRGGPPGGGKPPGDDDEDGRQDLKRRRAAQVPLEDADTPSAGWLHTYRTTRALRFLYLDGMSGDKGRSGVLDTQDLLLRGVRDGDQPPLTPPGKSPSRGPPGEHDRAVDLCRLCEDWELQGIIRTEGAGFEIIKCDFLDGLEQIQSLQRSSAGGDGHRGPHGRPPGGHHGGPPYGGPPGMPGGRRDPDDRYREVGSSRTLLDYSSMVSAFFFPVNITNPDSERAELPRLLGTTKAEMLAIRDYLTQVIQARHDAPITAFNWRDVADLVVRRYGAKVSAMAADVDSVEDMARQVRFLLEVYVDYSVEDEKLRNGAAQERCATFYIQTMPLETEADRLLFAAFKAVNARICGALFEVRELVVGDAGAGEEALEEAKDVLKALMEYLAWSIFE